MQVIKVHDVIVDVLRQHHQVADVVRIRRYLDAQRVLDGAHAEVVVLARPDPPAFPQHLGGVAHHPVGRDAVAHRDHHLVHVAAPHPPGQTTLQGAER